MKSYIDLLDQYEKYQGGFIWDYIDQALLVKDEITGREVLRYGEILMTVRRIMNFRETESYLQIEQKTGNAGGEILLWTPEINLESSSEM